MARLTIREIIVAKGLVSEKDTSDATQREEVAMALDTYKAVKKLREVGFDEAQAEAVIRMIGEAFDNSVATKADIAAVRTELVAQGAELRAEIQEVRTETQEVRTEIREVRTEMHAEAKAIRAEIRDLEQRMTIKLGGLLVLALTLLTAINKWLG